MREFLLVGAGGFFGACCRYGLSGLVQRLDPLGRFPAGTMVVNLTGCFLIGVLSGLAASRGVFGPNARLFLFIGLLGGFTTFSTFAFESLALAREGEVLKAGANVLGSVLLGLVFVWLGYSVAAR